MERPLARILNLIDPETQYLNGLEPAGAAELLLVEDPAAVLSIEGSFTLLARDGERVAMAWSLFAVERFADRGSSL